MPLSTPNPDAEAARRALERIAAAREQAQAMGPAPAIGSSAGPRSESAARESTLRVRCPHCQHQVAVAEETSWSQIVCADCGSSFSLIADRSSLAAAGARLGRFELVSPLGEGGFGAVWRARDTQLERAVALKFPRRGELSPVEA